VAGLLKRLFGSASAANAGSAQKTVPVFLNVGGNSKAIAVPPHFHDWQHHLLDIDPRGGADLVCDARKLREAVAGELYDAVYCSHNLEHYYRHDVDRVLRGFLHALKPGGFAEIRVPDIGALVKLLAHNDWDIEQEVYQSPAGPISAHDVFYGYGPEIEASGQDFYAHKTGFTRDSLLRALCTNGFKEIYFAAPLAAIELHVFAFKTVADAAQRASLGLDEPAAIEPRHRGPPAARRGVYDRTEDGADPVEALYQRAAAAFNANDWPAAAAATEQALAREPGLAPLHYLLGCCRLEQEQHQAALQSLTRCLELQPKYPLSAEASARVALCRARIDLAAGKQAASEALPAQLKSVSVLMCSIKPERAARAEAMYRELLAQVPHEIIVIRDARSNAEGYNRALRQAKNDVVVFTHDDIDIVSPDFAARLLRGLARHDIVGVAGTRKLSGGAWHFAGFPHLAGQVGMPGENGSLVVTLYGATEQESRGMLAVDGFLLATSRRTALDLGFDEITFDSWHLYDLDFCLRASIAGLDCATCNDILVVHDSQGSYDERWLEYSRRFLDKHKDRLGAMQDAFIQPELVSLPLRSAAEWRLLTQHMMLKA
jgi:tetratricopeptide (TPR) repeat protein